MPAMLIAVRGLNDNIELARSLGIPVPILHETKSDPASVMRFVAGRSAVKYLAPAIEKTRADEENIFRNLDAFGSANDVEKLLLV